VVDDYTIDENAEQADKTKYVPPRPEAIRFAGKCRAAIDQNGVPETHQCKEQFKSVCLCVTIIQ
jgi:hypothetical protein